MGYDALAGLEPKKPKKQAKAKPEAAERPPVGDQRVVRTPRLVPSDKEQKVDNVRSGESPLAAVRRNVLGQQAETQDRREKVLAWMLDGYTYEGELLTTSQLASVLSVPLKTLERDISKLKDRMADYYTNANKNDDAAALAYMLLEMKFQDRGRALRLYNIIMKDIKEADENPPTMLDRKGNQIKVELCGRDRASMYNAALAALDLSNKATTGMDSLFKMTGGAQRVLKIINIKNAQINNGNGQMVTVDELQRFAANELAGILPSTRKGNPLILPPAALDITDEDKKIMSMGSKK